MHFVAKTLESLYSDEGSARKAPLGINAGVGFEGQNALGASL
jgi:hypothetical protein